MKIHGPGGPKPPTPDETVEGPAKTDKPGEAFADKLRGGGGPGGPGGPSGPSGPSGPGGDDPVAAIAADLKAGRITPEQAVDRVIAAATESGVPSAAPESVRAQLREQLKSLVGDDPFLASKARRIGVDGGGEGA